MNQDQKPFGHHRPSAAILKHIEWCRQLPNNWLGKQLAQWMRKKVLKTAPLPLDLEFDGIRLRSQLTDNVSERGFVFMPWRWDTIERQWMLEALPADGVFIDIGANVGIYAAQAAVKLNRMGVVVAIEANPLVHQRLSFNMQATCEAMKEKPRVELLNLGVNDQAGTFDLYLDPDNLGASSLLDQQSGGGRIQVSCQTLMEVIESQKLSRVDVIKCDIEGAEDRALVPFLMEAPNHLLPHALIIENNQQLWQQDLHQLLKHRAYRLTRETRLNLIFQQQQPIRQTEREGEFSDAVPVVS